MKDVDLDCKHLNWPGSIFVQGDGEGMRVHCPLKGRMVPARECGPKCLYYKAGSVQVTVHKPRFPRFKARLERLVQRIP